VVRITGYLLFRLSKEAKMNLEAVGKWAFVIGLVVAVLAGLFFQPGWAIWVLAILGVIVGLLNVTAEETRGYLLASIALTLSATALNTIPVIGTALSYILPFVVAFVAGGMIVVALKELFQAARP
jgi:predicted PurR-regulated permease PerM